MDVIPLAYLGHGSAPYASIQNCHIFEYQAASKNWRLTLSDDGELFAANNQGLLHFNGEEWVLHKLPHETIIRSVAYIDEKIFSGSYEEFGYWQKNVFGLLEYTPSTCSLPLTSINSVILFRIPIMSIPFSFMFSELSLRIVQFSFFKYSADFLLTFPL